MTDHQKKIMQHLKFSAKNAITKKRLAQLTGIKPREVERAIRELIIQHGFRIGSSCERPFGYFIISTKEEMLRYRAQLLSRMKNLNERLRAADRQRAELIDRAIQYELYL